MEQAIDRETDGPDLVRASPRLLHDVGKPTRAGPGGRVSFHHHRGGRREAGAAAAARCAAKVIDEVAQLVFCTCASTATAAAEWTDSAVRRYVTDAGPLLAAAQLVRSDCTAQQAPGRPLRQRNYDEPGGASPHCASRENGRDPAPTSTATRSWRCSGSAGPLVGRAYKHMLAVRMERWPLSREEAEAELRRWAARGPAAG
jgi:poly(A) polymerase